MAIASLVLSNSAWGTPQATVRSTGDYDPNNCGFWGDSETLSITDNGREILQKRYCSAYGKSSASIVTDVHAHSYVLLQHSEGHGTNAWTDYLTVYELANHLIERKRVKLSEATGPTSRWTYELNVATPNTGGIKLTMTLKVDGTPEPEVALPEKMKNVEVRDTR